MVILFCDFRLVLWRLCHLCTAIIRLLLLLSIGKFMCRSDGQLWDNSISEVVVFVQEICVLVHHDVSDGEVCCSFRRGWKGGCGNGLYWRCIEV